MWSQDSDLNRGSSESVFLTMTGIHKYISLTFWDILPYFFPSSLVTLKLIPTLEKVCYTCSGFPMSLVSLCTSEVGNIKNCCNRSMYPSGSGSLVDPQYLFSPFSIILGFMGLVAAQDKDLLSSLLYI